MKVQASGRNAPRREGYASREFAPSRDNISKGPKILRQRGGG